MVSKFQMTTIEVANHSAAVMATRCKKTIYIRFFLDNNRFAYQDTLDKVSGEKVDDISNDEKTKCIKSLSRELKGKQVANRRWERSIGRK